MTFPELTRSACTSFLGLEEMLLSSMEDDVLCIPGLKTRKVLAPLDSQLLQWCLVPKRNSKY